MFAWRATLRKMLRRRGLALLRLDGTPPPTLRDVLPRLGAAAGGVFCQDGELATQTDLLAVFPAARVTFGPDLEPWRNTHPTEGWSLLVVDAESVDLSAILGDNQTRRAVANIVVRATLGHFWVGNGDLCEMTRAFRAAGFGLHDALGKVGLLTASAPSESMLFVYGNESLAPVSARSPAAEARVNEALAVLTPPLAEAASLRRLAGRGSFGFASGVLNPGALRQEDGRTLLLARGEQVPWVTQKTDRTSFMGSARPLLMELTAGSDAVARTCPVTLDGDETPGWRNARVEDFRLFRFRGESWSNCAITSGPPHDPPKGKPFAPDKLSTKIGLARFDPAAARLTLLGTPRLDRPTRAVEKNWSMFEANGDLHMIYSFNPYRLLRATNWPSLEFTTVHERPLDLPPDTLPASLRNSVNPVEYDERHFLHVIHAVFPTKRYAFWAVLIDRATLLPVRVSARPLVCGWRSASATIIYVTAVVAGTEAIEIYGGLNDSCVGRWTLRRDRLDAHWLPIA